MKLSILSLSSKFFGLVVLLFFTNLMYGQVPENDNPCNAIELVCNIVTSGNLAEATQTFTSTSGCDGDIPPSPSKDVWFTFSADGVSSYQMFADGFDGVLKIYTGYCSNPSGFVEVACSDVNNSSSEIIYLDNPDAGVYYVQYFEFFPSNAGDFTISIGCSPPDNDDPCDPVYLTCNTPYSGNLAVATPTSGGHVFSPGECGYTNDDWADYRQDVWFAFSSDGTSDYTVTATGLDGILVIYDGNYNCEMPDLFQLVECVDYVGGITDVAYLGSLPSGYYLIQYFPYFSMVIGDYTMTVSCTQPPNDQICDAVQLNCGSFYLGNTSNASQSISDMQPCYENTESGPYKDVWFKFIANGTSDYTLNIATIAVVFGSDPAYKIYKGTSCSTPEDLVEIECDVTTNTTISTTIHRPTPGIYYIQMYNAEPYRSGIYSIGLDCDLANDFMSDPAPLNCGDELSGNTTDATQSLGVATTCDGTTYSTPNKDVWFIFTADGESNYALVGDGFDGVLKVYSCTTCSGSVYNGDPYACIDVFWSADSLTLETPEAGDYLVQYFSYLPSQAGEYTMKLYCLPANDEPCDAIALNCGITVTGNNANATQTQTSTPLCNGYTAPEPNKDLWFEFTADGASKYSVVGNGFDGVIVVYTGDCSNPDALTSIDCVDELGGDTDSLGLGVLDAGTYLVQYFSYSSYYADEFTMTLHCIPANDDPCDATALTCGVSVTGNNSGASQTQTNTPLCNGYTAPEANKDVWFEFSADGSSSYSLVGNGFDGVIVVYTGDCSNPDALTSIDCVDEVGGDTDSLGLGVLDADTYLVQYFPYSSYFAGEFTMTLHCIPANDDPCNATVLACGVPVAGNNSGATQTLAGTTGCGYPTFAPNKDVWFSFVADGLSDYTLTGNGFDGIIKVYSGEDCTLLFSVPGGGYCVDELGGNSDQLTLTTPAADTYYVQYFSYSSYGAGAFTMELNCTPPVCESPTLSVSTIDASGAPLACVPLNGEYYLSIGIIGGAGNSTYTLTDGGSSTITIAESDAFYTFGPYPAGSSQTITATGNDDATCSVSASVNLEVCPPIYDCPALSANIGDACNDGDANTTGDLVTAACECVGTSTDASLNGSIDWAAACGSRSGTVLLFTPGTATVVASYPITVQADGSFSVSGLSAGTYDIIVQVDGFLTTGFEDLSVASGANTLAVGTLVNGDLNTDNAVTLLDFSITNAAYGSLIGDSNYNPLADVDCSGSINLLDISIINAAYGQTGVSAPL